MIHILKKYGIFEVSDKKNHYYFSDDISIDNVIKFLELKKEEFKEIRVQYIFAAECLNYRYDSFKTIIDKVDMDLSGISYSYKGFLDHISMKNNKDYFYMADIRFRYTEICNGHDCRIAEILCVCNA